MAQCDSGQAQRHQGIQVISIYPKPPLKIISAGIYALNICMENVQLTVADMASIKSLIELAANRGVFKVNEMSQVGTLYDKLSKFLEVSAEQLRQQPAQGDQNA
jgi:hypothetical protein